VATVTHAAMADTIGSLKMSIAEQRAFILGLTYALGLVNGFLAIRPDDASALKIAGALEQGIANAKIVLEVNEKAAAG